MSFFEDAVSAIIKPTRQFGSIIAQVVISESWVDDSDVTMHPTEISNVTDHIVLLPSKLLVRMGFTDYGLQSPGTYLKEGLNATVPPIPASTRTIYDNFLIMRAKKIPITIVTGKRTSKTMVIKTLAQETDYKTENSLIIAAYCQEIFIAQAQVVAVPPNSVHADASVSGSPTNYGSKILAPAPAAVTGP